MLTWHRPLDAYVAYWCGKSAHLAYVVSDVTLMSGTLMMWQVDWFGDMSIHLAESHWLTKFTSAVLLLQCNQVVLIQLMDLSCGSNQVSFFLTLIMTWGQPRCCSGFLQWFWLSPHALVHVLYGLATRLMHNKPLNMSTRKRKKET